MRLYQVLGELKQRHLYRVAVIYAASGWLLLQVADVIGESFDWPQWLMQGIIFVVIAGFPCALLLFWFIGAHDDEADANIAESAVDSDTPAPSSRPSLIVIPFDCYSDQPEDRWITDALTEDLTTLIARFADYAVTARNTAQVYKANSVDIRKLGEELNVRYALEGSLRRLANGVRVNAQLIDTSTGTHLWAEKYDCEDSESLLDELCRLIVLKLGNELTRAEMNLSRRTPPAQWGAWELYQQARGMLQFSGWNRQSFTEIAKLLEQAIEKDPDYAPAQAYYALILALGYWARLFPDLDTVFDKALAAANKALALAPESSEVLGFAGCALSDLGQHERGIPIIERAVELNPANSQAFAALGAAKILSGRFEEGVSDLRAAVKISPADPGLAPWLTMLSVSETYSGNAEGAREYADRACKADLRYFGGYLALALALATLEQTDGAQQALDEARALNPDLSAEAVSSLMGEPAWAELAKSGVRLPESPPQL